LYPEYPELDPLAYPEPPLEYPEPPLEYPEPPLEYPEPPPLEYPPELTGPLE